MPLNAPLVAYEMLLTVDDRDGLDMRNSNQQSYFPPIRPPRSKEEFTKRFQELFPPWEHVRERRRLSAQKA